MGFGTTSWPLIFRLHYYGVHFVMGGCIFWGNAAKSAVNFVSLIYHFHGGSMTFLILAL